MSKKLLLLVLLCVAGAAVPLYFAGLDAPLKGRDFSDIWLAGGAARAGINPSDPAAFAAFGRSLLGDHIYNWPYPPPMLFASVPISVLPHDVGFFVWNAVTATLFYVACRPFVPRNLRVLALLTPAALLSMVYGQTGFLVGALWFFAFRWSPIAALLLIKPHMGFLAGVNVLTSWREALIGIGMGAALIVASALIFGGWHEFFSLAGSGQAAAIWNHRWITWVRFSTAPGVGYGLYGWLLFAAGAAWFLSRDFNVWTAATATMLISPYGYHYDMTVICAGLLLLLYERKLTPLETAVIVIAFLSPAWVRVIGTWLVPPFLLAALAIQTSERGTVPASSPADGDFIAPAEPRSLAPRA